jgi:predicted aldo/keto reductase-like oxidoreductase
MLVTGKGRFAGDPTAPMRYGEAARPVSIKKLRLLGWVLGHDVACVVESGIGTDPASQDAAIDAARTPLSQREAALLERYAAAMSPHYCRGCDSLCGAACPEGLSIAPALQFLMYERAYGWHERATRHYRALERPWAERCASCQACSEACPYGVDAAAGMRAARRLLAGDGRV